MRVIGLDPGPSNFAWAVYDSDQGDVTRWGEGSPLPYCADLVGIERVRSYGQIVGNAILETSETVGRLEEMLVSPMGWDMLGYVHLIPRRTIVAHLTGSAVGGDKQVNAAVNLICPNFAAKRKGLNGHHRAAAAVAITCYDKYGKGSE